MKVKTVILGAGAAGMMCAARTGVGTLVIDHARNPGEKIRISGGGRCNFTNMSVGADNYLSDNPHFCKSALARYSPWDFVDLVNRYGIAWHEKTLGQLFCDDSARQIVDMLVRELTDAGAELWVQTSVTDLHHVDGQFVLRLERQGKSVEVTCQNLVLATGGKSIPKMGATGLAYDIARQFGLPVTDTRPGLVPFTWPDGRFKPLAGVSVPVRLSNHHTSFDEAMLFTHRGLSGPAVLQLSSYWREGEEIQVDLSPAVSLFDLLRSKRAEVGAKQLSTVLAQHLPARLVEFLSPELSLTRRLADQSDAALHDLADRLHGWVLTPVGSEGYRTAEVTLGGIATDAISAKTFEVKSVPGLFAIGEAVDVTGWLGGYNFQWAWASGHAAGTAIAARVADT